MIIVYYLVIFKAQYKKSVFNAPPLIYSFSGSWSKISVLIRLI